jgi:hypothetical protein
VLFHELAEIIEFVRAQPVDNIAILKGAAKPLKLLGGNIIELGHGCSVRYAIKKSDAYGHCNQCKASLA